MFGCAFSRRLCLGIRLSDIRSPGLKCFWTRASCDCGGLQTCDVTRRWNFCLMTTLTLILTQRLSRRLPWP